MGDTACWDPGISGLIGGVMAEPTPLCVLLRVMRERLDRRDEEGAFAAARAAAPYVHGRAAVVRAPGEAGGGTG